MCEMTEKDECDKLADERWTEVMRRREKILPLFADMELRLGAHAVAKCVGLRDAGDLNRWLVLKQLSPYRRLRLWIYVEQMVSRFDDEQTLNHWAEQRGSRASSYYRFVEKETGHAWGDLKRLGPWWIRRHALNAWGSSLS